MAGLLLLAVPARGIASIQVSIVPSSGTVAPGSEFDVLVQIAQAGSSFNAFDAIVGYDPGALSLILLSPLSQQEGSLMKSACANTFHRFRRGADRDTATLALLCSGVSVAGPGAIYRLRYRASSTPQTTVLRLLPGLRFYNAGISVTPVLSSDATIEIAGPVDVGGFRPVPKGVRLRAVPSPSRSTTTFEVETDVGSEQELLVCDVLGRVVRTVERGWFPAGRRGSVWTGTDESGRRVPAGLYFVRLRAGEKDIRSAFVRLD